MPLVRISYSYPRSPETEQRLSASVHEALVEAFGVPADDFFQVVSHHDSTSGMRGPGSFLGIDHSRELTFIQITCAEGRSIDQKKALYAAIVKRVSAIGLRAEDTIINLVETKRENWSFGNGFAPFAPE